MRLADAKLMRTYLRYIVPSALAFLLQGFYSVVDGLFVGRAIGDAGMAGINLSYPLMALVLSVGTGIGIGGAVINSVRLGEGNTEGAQQAVGHTIFMLAASVPVVMLVLLPFHQQLLYLMGARSDVLFHANGYITVGLWGAVFQIFSSGFIPLLRNKGKVMYAMVISIVGGSLNCVGDYIMVFNLGWGAPGSGLSTVISQAFVFVCGAAFFLKKQHRPAARHLRPSLALCKRTLRNGIAPFALTILPEVTTISLNISCGAWGGGLAQAALAVISYTGVSVQWVVQGVNDGAQPLISRYFGGGQKDAVKALRNTNFLFAAGVGLVGVALLLGFKQLFTSLFGTSPEASALFYTGVGWFCLGLPLYGFNHAVTAYFYATETGKFAAVITVSEAVLICLFAYLCPLAFGLDGCWISVPVSQTVLLALSLVLLKRTAGLLEGRLEAQALRARDFAGDVAE